jgi:ABC-type transport system substrate-binding protein
MRYSFLYFFILFLLSCNNIDEDLSIFRYNEVSGISTLDPAYSKDQATTWVANQLFNGLVQLDSNLDVVPCIAKQWVVSDDALEYTFLLRDDVYFHHHEIFNNPRKVVSSDFKYSFQRLLDENIASPGAWVLNNVKDFCKEIGVLRHGSDNADEDPDA